MRVEVSVDDVERGRQDSKRYDNQQQLERVQTKTDSDVVIPVGEVYQRTNTHTHTHRSRYTLHDKIPAVQYQPSCLDNTSNAFFIIPSTSSFAL